MIELGLYFIAFRYKLNKQTLYLRLWVFPEYRSFGFLANLFLDSGTKKI